MCTVVEREKKALLTLADRHLFNFFAELGVGLKRMYYYICVYVCFYQLSQQTKKKGREKERKRVEPLLGYFRHHRVTIT